MSENPSSLVLKCCVHRAVKRAGTELGEPNCARLVLERMKQDWSFWCAWVTPAQIKTSVFNARARDGDKRLFMRALLDRLPPRVSFELIQDDIERLAGSRLSLDPRGVERNTLFLIPETPMLGSGRLVEGKVLMLKLKSGLSFSTRPDEGFYIFGANARVAFRNGKWFVNDLGSDAGTFVNGRKIGNGSEADLRGFHKELNDHAVLESRILSKKPFTKRDEKKLAGLRELILLVKDDIAKANRGERELEDGDVLSFGSPGEEPRNSFLVRIV